MADINGTNSSETLSGTQFDDKISTRDGDDTVFAGDGDDQINGTPNANGSYSYNIVTGRKLIYGEAGNDFLVGGPDNDTLDGGNGNDRILSGGGIDLINGGGGDDQINTFVEQDGTVSYYSFTGKLNVDGGAGNDVIRGTSGDDTLDGGEGADKLSGGAGNDHYFVDNLADYVEDNQGSNTGLIKVDFFKQPTGVVWKLGDGVKPLPYWIDALVGDGTEYIDAQKSLASGIIKYAFPDTPLATWSDKDKFGFTPMNAAQRAFVEKCLSYIETIINVKFERVSDASQVGVLTFANNEQSGSAGYAVGGLSSQKWGIFFNNTGSSAAGNAAPRDGEAAAQTFIHEIGHALGLKHPHNQSAGGGQASNPPYLSSQEDITTFTQLSYNENREDYVSQFRELDIAALQYLYGPANINGSAKNQTGDNVYTIQTTQRNFIWDGGGSDTLDASNSNMRVVLSLEVGSHSYFGSSKNQYITADGQITINFGTVIEDVLGTQFDDVIIGNSVANYLWGNNGNDEISGGPGDDNLRGGLGNDILDGEAGVDVAYYNETFFGTGITVDLQAGTASGGAGNDKLISIERVWASIKDDKLYGGYDQDFFVGDKGDDYVDGRAGVDYFQINNDVSECSWVFDGDTCVVTTKNEGTDRLVNVERIYFVGTTTTLRTIEEIRSTASNRFPEFSSSSQSVSTNEDTSRSVALAATDADGDALTYSVYSSASNGTASVSGSTVTYTPRANFNGSDSFIVRASDGKGGTATQTINLTVASVNDAPTFLTSSQSVSVAAGTAKTITLAATDVDGDTLTYTVANPSKGTATISGSTLTYTPTSSATGTDSFTVTANDGKGGTATQTISVTVSAATTTATQTFRLVAPDGWVGSVGGNGLVVGTSGFQDVRITSGAVSLDGSFNTGNDIVSLDGDASGYSIVRSGSAATISKGGSVSLTVPIGTTGAPIVFDDGPRKLVFNNPNFNFGAQTFSTTQSAITAGPDGAALPTGASASAIATAILVGVSLPSGQTSHISISGTAKVVGTSVNEVVQIIASSKSNLTFDPSFNQGGDVIVLGRDAGSFTAQRSGSSMLLVGPTENLTIPIGSAGLTLRFTDEDRSLAFSNGEYKIGTQSIGMSATQLTVSITTTSVDVGTAASPVTLNASTGAVNFTDNVAFETNVRITGFGADDRITVTGATSSRYSFTTINTDGNSTADLVITFNNTTASVENSITLVEAVNTNAFVLDYATAQAAIGNAGFMLFG